MTEAHAVDAGRIVGDVARLLAASFGELVPPEAQVHLINAQRELLLAIAVVIEHNASRTPRQPRGRRRAATEPGGRRPQRVELD